MVQEHLQILLYLDGVVLHLGDGEDAHLAVLPRAVLLQQERQQHQQPAVVHDPPDVNVSSNLQGFRRKKRGDALAGRCTGVRGAATTPPYRRWPGRS